MVQLIGAFLEHFITNISKKYLSVACYLWVLCRSGSNLRGRSSSSSPAFVYPGTCDFHAVEADYEACVWVLSIICHLVQNISGEKIRWKQYLKEGCCMKAFRDYY
jgi:hypothetical protein